MEWFQNRENRRIEIMETVKAVKEQLAKDQAVTSRIERATVWEDPNF